MMKKAITVVSMIAAITSVLILLLPIINKTSIDFDVLNKYQNDLDENLKITVQYEEIVRGQDEYAAVDSYIRCLYDVPQNFDKIIRLSVIIDNKTKHSFYGSICPVQNENVFIQSECLDTNDPDPTPPSIESNSKERLRLYVFVNHDLTETEIMQALEKAEYSFNFYIYNSEDSMNPYNVTAKGKFIDGKAEPNPWTTPPYTG